MGIYDLFDVIVGDEVISARPISWSGVDSGDGKDESGEEIVANRYNGTCPQCGQLLEFTPEDVVMLEGEAAVECSTCGATPSEKSGPSNMEVRHVRTKDEYTFTDDQDVIGSGNRPKSEKKEEITINPTKDDCPFQDPIEAGELVPDKA